MILIFYRRTLGRFFCIIYVGKIKLKFLEGEDYPSARSRFPVGQRPRTILVIELFFEIESSLE